MDAFFSASYLFVLFLHLDLSGDQAKVASGLKCSQGSDETKSQIN